MIGRVPYGQTSRSARLLFCKQGTDIKILLYIVAVPNICTLKEVKSMSSHPDNPAIRFYARDKNRVRILVKNRFHDMLGEWTLEKLDRKSVV